MKRSRKGKSKKPVRASTTSSIEGSLSDRFRMVMGGDVVLTVAKDESGHTVSLMVGDKIVSLTGITAIGGLSCSSVKDPIS